MLQAVKRPVKDWVREKFHRIFYNSKIWKEVHWLGVPVLKCPFDLWTYQQILWETRPTLIVECGTNRGGSAFFFATLFDLMQDGRVITIDVNDMKPPAHPRVKYILGSSADPKVRDLIKAEGVGVPARAIVREPALLDERQVAGGAVDPAVDQHHAEQDQATQRVGAHHIGGPMRAFPEPGHADKREDGDGDEADREADGRGLDAAGHFRPQDNRLIGPQAADGRQPAREGDFLDGGNGHPGRGGGSGFGNGLGGRGGRRQPARHKNAERGPRGQPCRDGGQQYCFFHARMWRCCGAGRAYPTRTTPQELD